MITRKEFIDSIMEFANRMADTIYGAQKDLFSQEAPVEEQAPVIGRFKPRCAFPRVGDIANKIFCISREDCSLLVQVIEKKYNNFN